MPERQLAFPYVEASNAIISADGRYRYGLSRYWGPGRRMAWIMLNPSTADAEVDDPTIRRCIGFARRKGFAGIEVLNLYALRATDPLDLYVVGDPEGPENALCWGAVLHDPKVAMVVAAWGFRTGGLPGSRAFAQFGACEFQCLGTTASGAPRHPLYVRGDQPLEPFRVAS